MSAKSDLFGTYDAWREWTEAESDAIRQSDWPLVTRCQQTKQLLQSRIVSLTEEAEAESSLMGRDFSEVQREIRAVIQELILLETRNDEYMAEQCHAARTRGAELERAARNLQRVKGSYAPSTSPAGHLYSRQV